MLSVSTMIGSLVSKCLDIPVMVKVMYKTTKSNPRMKRRVYLTPSSWWISLKNVTITDRVSCLSFVDDFSNLRKWWITSVATPLFSAICLGFNPALFLKQGKIINHWKCWETILVGHGGECISTEKLWNIYFAKGSLIETYCCGNWSW